MEQIEDPAAALVPGSESRRAPPAGAGPLAGTTFVVKDTIDVAGLVTGAGNPEWARTHAPAARDATCVGLLRAAGSGLLAKARCPELAWSLSGENVHFGMPLNAAAPGRDPGGSSSGSAAAVAAEICDIGLGSDTLGSIRVPASYCGLWGVRPTHGAVPVDGVVPLAPSLDAVGVLTRDLATLRAATAVLLGERWAAAAAPGRIAVADDAFDLVDDATRAVLESAAEAVGTASGGVARIRLLGDAGAYAAALEDLSVVQAHEAWRAHGEWVRAHEPNFGPGVAERFARAASVTDDEADAARGRQHLLRLRIREVVGEGLVVALPAAGGPAPPRDAEPDERQATRLGAARVSLIASVGGCPQIAAPAPTQGGPPVGLGLLGAPGSEAMLLRAAEPLA